MRRIESAGGIVLSADRVVVVCQGGRSWSLPKGQVEEGEKPVDAARREIEEETGLANLTLIRPLGRYEREGARHREGQRFREWKTIHMFLFRDEIGREPLHPQDGAITDARWMPVPSAVARLSHPADREFLESLAEELQALRDDGDGPDDARR